jgi:hypothetical protein
MDAESRRGRCLTVRVTILASMSFRASKWEAQKSRIFSGYFSSDTSSTIIWFSFVSASYAQS